MTCPREPQSGEGPLPILRKLRASDQGRAGLWGLVEGFYVLVLHNQGRMHDVVHSADAALEALRASNQPWQLVDKLAYLEHALTISGRPEDALELSDEVRTMASQLEHAGASFVDEMAMGYREWFRGGNTDRLIELGLHGAEAWKPAGPWYLLGRMFVSMASLWKGEWARAVDEIATVVREFPENWWTGMFRGWEFVAHAYVGTGDDALAVFREREDRLPQLGEASFAGEKIFAVLATEGLAVLGERDRAAALYPVAREAVDDGIVSLPSGLGQRYLGIAAACGEQWDASQEHFETALEQAHDMPFRLEQPETRRWYAWMLLDRDQPGDKDKATTLLGEAIEMYEELGMPKHVGMAEELLGSE